MSRLFLTLIALILLFLFWLFRPGPGPADFIIPETLPEPAFEIEDADQAIRMREQQAGPLKPDNHARIVWNPEYQNRKAPCSIVYIHGFSASWGEGAPLHIQVARSLGCHLYLPRLHGHGLKTGEPLKDMDAGVILEDAAEAVAVGNLLGEQVVVIGNSMGGMLSLHLASAHPESIDILVLFAPLIDFAGRNSVLFDRVWGQRLMRLILMGPYFHSPADSDDHGRYWYHYFRTEALMTLKHMKNTLLTDSVYENITQPVFAGYYYEDDDRQDDVVSVEAIREIESRLGTPSAKREFHAFTKADAHVISSAYRTDGYREARDALTVFLKKHLSFTETDG